MSKPDTLASARATLRAAIAALREARCRCHAAQPPNRHDPYDMTCPRAAAERDRDEAIVLCEMAAMDADEKTRPI